MSRHPSPSTDRRPLIPSYRLVILGGGGVGKTALLKRFLQDEFVEKHRETVEDLHNKPFKINGQLMNASILDTAGNMSFPAMRRLNIGNGNAFVLVYSVTSMTSFQNVKEILDEIKMIRYDFRSLPIVVVANKRDQTIEKWEINRQQMDEFMLNETMDCRAAHLEASAKTGYNVLAIFESLVRLSPNFTIDQSIDTDRSSRVDTPLMNGVQHVSNNNASPSSPRRRKAHPPALNLRRFSLQAFNLSAISAAIEKNKRPSTEIMDSRKGSVPAVVGAPPRKPSRPSQRRRKSNEDIDIQECNVQ